MAGRIEEGLDRIAHALHASDKTGERHYRAELHRLNGELLLMRVAADFGEAVVAHGDRMSRASSAPGRGNYARP